MADVTITGLRVAPMGGPRVPTTVRAFARSSFLLADGNTAITATSPYTNEPYYKSVALNLSGLTYAAADFTLPATTDSVDNPNGARWGLFVFDQNNRLMYEVEGLGGLDSFWLDHTDASQSPEDIRSHNLGSLPTLNDHDVNITGDLTVDGSVTATQFNGNGAGLTGVLGAGSGGTASSGSLSLIADIDNTDAGELIDAIFGSGGSSQTVFRLSRKLLTAYRPFALPAYTFASLPTPSDVPGGMARVSDSRRGLWRSDAAQWIRTAKRHDPQDWGCKWDGSTDDSTNFQACVDDVHTAGGGAIELPFGVGKLHDITFPAGSKLAIIGQGMGTRVANPSASGDTFSQTGDAISITMRDFQIHPSVARNSGVNEIKIASFGRVAEGAVYLENLEILNCARAIFLGNTTTASGRVWLHSLRGYGFDNFLHAVRVLDGWFTGGWSIDSGKNAGNGIKVDGGCSGLSFQSMDVINTAATPSGSALTIKKDLYTASESEYFDFAGCFFDSYSTGADIEDVRGVLFNQCWFSDRPGAGVFITSGADQIVFRDCQAENCGGNGYYVSGAGTVQILGGHIIGNNSQANGVGSIFSAGVANDQSSGARLEVSSVLFANGNGFPGSHHHDVWLANNAGTKFNIHNNWLTNGINNLAGTSATRVVANNIT